MTTIFKENFAHGYLQPGLIQPNGEDGQKVSFQDGKYFVASPDGRRWVAEASSKEVFKNGNFAVEWMPESLYNMRQSI